MKMVTKKNTEKSATFAVGGSGHMVGKKGVGAQTPGVVGVTPTNPEGKFLGGGKGNSMVKFAGVKSVTPGKTSVR
jgi:hypothetical protein